MVAIRIRSRRSVVTDLPPAAPTAAGNRDAGIAAPSAPDGRRSSKAILFAIPAAEVDGSL
jgi:hypothetical protein